MCSREQAELILREAYQACNDILCKKIEQAYLYGSYARGDHDAASDMDIILITAMNAQELSGCRRTVAQISSRLSLEHDVTVSITVKPAEQFARFRDVLPFYRNVVREGVCYAG